MIKLTIGILIIISAVLVFNQFHSANAELQSGKSYIIYANGHDLGNKLEYTLELQLLIGSGSSNKIPISLVEGLVIHDNLDFITSSNWKGTLLKNEGLMMLSGNATTYDGTQLSMILLGKLVNNTKDGANYKLVGSLTHEKQRMILTQVTEIAEIHSLTLKQILKEMPHIFFNQNKDLERLQVPPTKKTDAITVIVKHPDRAYVHNYVYSITTKVYLLKENPKGDFDLHGGEVQGAHVTIDIINQNNEIVKSFDGITDKLGYYSDLFIIPDNFTAGLYVVHVTAEKDEINDTNDSVLHVFYPPLVGAKIKSVVPITTGNLTISIASPTDGSTIGTSSFVISGTASGTNLSSITVTVDGIPVTVTGITSWSAPSGILSDGSHSITAAAFNNAMNTASQTVHVTLSTGAPVIQDIQQLIRLKESMNFDKGITRSLDAKLNAAIASLNYGANKTAKNQLNAFINEVYGQTGKKLTQDQATELIHVAQNIINLIH